MPLTNMSSPTARILAGDRWSGHLTAVIYAFALIQNLTPTTPDRTAGPIYVVNTTTGATVVTPGIGSIYGHNYVWYGTKHALLFERRRHTPCTTSVITPDPHVWQVFSAMTSQVTPQVAEFHQQ